MSFCLTSGSDGRGIKTFAGAKVRRNFDICKRKGIFLRKMSGSHPDATDETRGMICRTIDIDRRAADTICLQGTNRGGYRRTNPSEVSSLKRATGDAR